MYSTKYGTKHSNQGKPKQGFTLIELSIVLVIIGLIVGGVLVGQDLIKAAQLRATISQYQEYNTAANTFRIKYNGMPGDLKNADIFGLPPAGETSGVTNGNRIIESSIGSGNFSNRVSTNETVCFWRHLGAADLIAASSATTNCNAGFTGSVEVIKTNLPEAKIGKNNFWIVYGQPTGRNFYALMGLDTMSSVFYNTQVSLTPLEALQIDEKIDDGNPGNGSVTAVIDGVAPIFVSIPADFASGDDCVTSATQYNTSDSDAASTNACGLNLKVQF